METVAERRRRRIRGDIARIAIGLFVAHGFDAVTIDDIAQAADISGRTFFRYFATKDEVVLDYERQLQQRLLHALEARPPGEGAVSALGEAYRVTATVQPADRGRVVDIGRILDATPGLRARAQGERLADAEAFEVAIEARLTGRNRDVRARVIVASMGAVAAREFRAWVADGGVDDLAGRVADGLALIHCGLGQLDPPRRSRRGAA
jgi:AcrR family transcriptional regulator